MMMHLALCQKGFVTLSLSLPPRPLSLSHTHILWFDEGRHPSISQVEGKRRQPLWTSGQGVPHPSPIPSAYNVPNIEGPFWFAPPWAVFGCIGVPINPTSMATGYAVIG